jgi:hypothetical protein
MTSHEVACVAGVVLGSLGVIWVDWTPPFLPFHPTPPHPRPPPLPPPPIAIFATYCKYPYHPVTVSGIHEISNYIILACLCERFENSQTKKTYKAKVALQLWIKPDSYKVGPQTVGATEEIDPKFSNQEIEWSTVERGAVHMYGLLVNLKGAILKGSHFER